jgi:lipid-A-disaccharide synthase
MSRASSTAVSPLTERPVTARRKVLLVAGEASGDLHGAALLTALLRNDPSLEVSGIGGERLRAAGMHILVDTAAVATMGIVETFGTLGRLVSAYRRLVRFMTEERPCLLILIDYPEFNLFLAKRAKALGIPVFYYIGPQVWAWRRGRVRTIARRVDRLGVVFPFEPELYNTAQPLAEFVGHPLLDVVQPTRARAETLARYGLDPGRPVLALLPGSRQKEVRHLLAPSLTAAQRLMGEGWQTIIALAHTLRRDDLVTVLGAEPSVPIAVDDTYNVVHAADAALVASGTATLETALLGRPMVIMYRVSRVTFAVARLLVRGVKYMGMPNIILGRQVFPELMQGRVTADNLITALHDVVRRRVEVTAALEELRHRLGEPGAAQRAAELALQLIP